MLLPIPYNTIAERLKLRVATRAQAKLELVIVDNGARMTHSMTHIFTERAKRIQSVEWGRKARECVSSVFF